MAFVRSTLPARVVGAVAVATLTASGLGIAGASVVSATPVVVETTPPAPEPTTAAPEPTTAPPDEPATTTAPGETTDDDGTDWLPIVLIIVGVVALLVILGMVLGRGSRKPAPAPRSTQPSSRSTLLSTSQWIHDQLTLELAAAEPASARQRWVTERSRLDNVAIGAQQEWSQGHGDAWQTLGQTMSALANAVDTNINLRSQNPPDATLIAESTEVVNRQRAALQQLITALWPTVNR